MQIELIAVNKIRLVPENEAEVILLELWYKNPAWVPELMQSNPFNGTQHQDNQYLVTV